MASVMKLKSNEYGGLLKHNNRLENDGVEHSNETINPAKTYMNYHLKKGTSENVKSRLDEIFKVPNKNAVVMCEWVITIPSNVKSEDERAFFEAVYDYFSSDLGEENIINAVVHKYEATPHIHIDFVPVVKGEYVCEHSNNGVHTALMQWKETHSGELERLCAKDVITRNYLMSTHPKLNKFVDEKLGYPVAILNGATANGNKSITALKLQELQKEISNLEQVKKNALTEVQALFNIARSNNLSADDMGYLPLLQKIDDLENQNKILQNIIRKNGYTYTKDDLASIRNHKYVPAKTCKVSVFDGNIYNDVVRGNDIAEDNCVMIFNIPPEINEPITSENTLSLAKMMEIDNDLERQAKLAKSSSSDCTLRKSKTSDRLYMFLKQKSTPKETASFLVDEFVRQIRDLKSKGITGFGTITDKMIYMEAPKHDTYNLALKILQEEELTARYYSCRNEYKEQEERQQLKEQKEQE